VTEAEHVAELVSDVDVDERRIEIFHDSRRAILRVPNGVARVAGFAGGERAGVDSLAHVGGVAVVNEVERDLGIRGLVPPRRCPEDGLREVGRLDDHVGAARIFGRGRAACRGTEGQGE
jgi:hypothetical protein